MSTDLLPLLKAFSINSLGQDSEFFLWDTQADKLVPSYAYFPPKEAKLVNRDGSVYRDGLAVEVNSYPEWCRAYVMDFMKDSLRAGRQMANLPPHIKFTSRPYVEFTEELVKDFPADLRILGCSPTLDAYTEKQKVLKINPRKLLYRTSGSHLHMGFRLVYNGQANVQPQELSSELFAPWAKAADLFLGVPFAYIFNSSDEFKRRQLYGQAGEFRYQRYSAEQEVEQLAKQGNVDYSVISRGLEYRALSSRLWDHPMVASLFLLFFKYVVGNPNFVWSELPAKWEKGWEDTIREAINLGSPKALEESLKLFSTHFPQSVTSRRFHTDYAPLDEEATFQLFNKLRELAKGFEDAGFVNSTTMPESHYGFNDYAANNFTFNPTHANFNE